MICKQTGAECQTPSMCSPHGGCPDPREAVIRELRAAVVAMGRVLLSYHGTSPDPLHPRWQQQHLDRLRQSLDRLDGR